MGSISIVVKTPKVITPVRVKDIPRYLLEARKVISGINSGSVTVQASSADPVQASGTITLTHASIAADDTVTVLGVTLTAKASGAVANQFNIGANATADAVALAACINANATIAQALVATSALGVVTIKAITPGVVGNYLLAMATSNAPGFAIVQLAGGTGGASGSSVSYVR